MLSVAVIGLFRNRTKIAIHQGKFTISVDRATMGNVFNGRISWEVLEQTV
jgi:hypothetical protein